MLFTGLQIYFTIMNYLDMHFSEIAFFGNNSNQSQSKSCYFMVLYVEIVNKLSTGFEVYAYL